MLRPALRRRLAPVLAAGVVVATMTATAPPASATLTAGPATLVSESGGVPGVGASTEPALSDSGRFVAFLSEAVNFPGALLAPGRQAYVRDLSNGTLTMASANAAGTGGNNDTISVRISGDMKLTEAPPSTQSASTSASAGASARSSAASTTRTDTPLI